MTETVEADRSPAAPGASKKKGRRATIQDVARVAGVSVSAVSKVVRNAYGVSPQMHARVSAAIDELDYRPNTGARAMRGQSFTIGVVLTELLAPFQSEMAQGISDGFENTPYQDILTATGSDPERTRRRVEALLDRQVDGLVLIAPHMSVEAIDRTARTVPTVTIALHGPSRNFDTVTADNNLGPKLVVDHLVAQGHRRIVHTSHPGAALEPDFMVSQTARRLGFERAMRGHRLTPDVIETSYTEQGGYEAAAEALDRLEPPTAIFAGTDVAAYGVMRAAEERGLRIPEDLSVVGYDNIATSAINRIALTTVDQSAHATGEACAQLLLERIGGRTESRRVEMTPELIIRTTTGPPPSAA